MSRLSDYVIPFEEIGSDEPRCKFCLGKIVSGDESFSGVCDECRDAMEERYKALMRDNFTQDELDWLVERDEITAEVSDWLREVAEAE